MEAFQAKIEAVIPYLPLLLATMIVVALLGWGIRLVVRSIRDGKMHRRTPFELAAIAILIVAVMAAVGISQYSDYLATSSVAHGGPEEIPRFPAKPPQPSTMKVLPRTQFVPVNEAGASVPVLLADVDGVLRDALRQAGQEHASYYSTAGGFALVARLERFEPDGTPSAADVRFLADPEPVGEFSLSDYLRILARGKRGRFRLFVFVVSSKPLVAEEKPRPMSADEADGWLLAGGSVLPDIISQLEYTPQHTCTVLVYEFERTDVDRSGRVLRPSTLLAGEHLDKSGLGRVLK